jgi:hypothetical protein
MSSHANLDIACLEVLKGGKFALDERLDTLSDFIWRDLEAVKILTEDGCLN